VLLIERIAQLSAAKRLLRCGILKRLMAAMGHKRRNDCDECRGRCPLRPKGGQRLGSFPPPALGERRLDLREQAGLCGEKRRSYQLCSRASDYCSTHDLTSDFLPVLARLLNGPAASKHSLFLLAVFRHEVGVPCTPYLRPIISALRSDHDPPASDVQNNAGDPRGIIASEIECCVGDVLRRPKTPDRMPFDEFVLLS
jgi:hypothetical protein